MYLWLEGAAPCEAGGGLGASIPSRIRGSGPFTGPSARLRRRAASLPIVAIFLMTSSKDQEYCYIPFYPTCNISLELFRIFVVSAWLIRIFVAFVTMPLTS